LERANEGRVVYSELELINNSIQYCVVKTRDILFKEYDAVLNNKIKELKNIEGVSHYEDDKHDQIVFILPLTPQQTKISFPDSS